MKQSLLLVSATLFFACSSNPTKDVERISLPFDTVTDSIYTRMPGKFLLGDNHLVWTDPFTTDGFVHVIDPVNGKEIGVMGNIGGGPEEFKTPSINTIRENRLFVFDINSNKEALFSIDHLVSNEPYYIPLNPGEDKFVTRKLMIDDKTFLSLTPSEEKPFKLEHNGTTITFGHFPISEQIENKFDFFQGDLEYCEERKLLIYACIDLDYFAIYKRESDTSFSLLIEKKGDIRYRIVEGNLIKDIDCRRGVKGLTLTKDFIVTLSYDYERVTVDRDMGMDMSKLPQTVFLYDYEGVLKKIVSLEVPVLRIAGNIKQNTLYAVIVNPEYEIVKCNLTNSH